MLRKQTGKRLIIDFNREWVTIVFLEYSGHLFRLLNYSFKKISSKQTAKEETVNFINNFLRLNALSIKEAYLTVSVSEGIAVKHLSLPRVPEKELMAAAGWQLKEDLSWEVSESLVDWQIAREYPDEEGAVKTIIAFALAKKEVIAEYVSILRECRLSPSRVSTAPFDYANILRGLAVGEKVCALLDIGYQDTTLCIYQNARLQFIRKLPFSYEKLILALSGTAVSDSRELSYTQAEGLLALLGVPRQQPEMPENTVPAMRIISLLRPQLEFLAKEIKSSFDYFASEDNRERPAPCALYLAGEAAKLKNLDTHLGESLDIYVSKLPLPECIDIALLRKEAVEKDWPRLIGPLGAALAGDDSINLLPPELRSEKIETIEKGFLRVVAFSAAAVFFVSLFIVNIQLRDYRHRLENVRPHLQSVLEIKTLKEKINRRENVIDVIQRGKVPASGLLKAVSALIPADTVLNELTLDQSGHTLILKGVIFSSGEAAESSLTKLMKDIETCDFFTEAELVSAQKTAEDQLFEIKCDLVY